MTQELIVVRGLPGSGKSTRALKWVADDPDERARVNRDALREAVFGKPYGVLSPIGEAHVTAVQRRITRELLDLGRSVVVDDTNLDDALVKYWGQLAAKYDVAFTVWDMRDVDVDTCIERDLNRAAAGGRYVTEQVIRWMHERQATTWQT